MTHAVDGTLVAIRDGALIDADEGIHVSGCDVCARELERAVERSDRVRAALVVVRHRGAGGRREEDEQGQGAGRWGRLRHTVHYHTARAAVFPFRAC